MSVTTYEIGCSYRHPKLKNKVYFLSKSFFNPSTNEVTVSIDSGGASVSIVTHVPHPTPPNVIEGFGIKFTETESLDERYKFTKQLNISINGHLTNTEWVLEHDYYIMVETIDGTFYLINVDFPSEMSFTYNLSNSQDQTDFVFTSNSNFPALKVNSVPWEEFNTCKTYHAPGVDYLKLLEKDYTTIDKENGVVNLFNSQTFKNIDYLKNTISLQETYDGDIATTTISFEIPFDDYKTSWQYNLLEFKQNLYVAQVGNINGNAIFAGFEHGLEPQYEINGSTSESESTSIKITLTEASNWGIFEYDSWSYYNVPEKKWIGVDSEVKCIGLGYGINTLMMEVDENGTPTGRYKCLEGYESEYTDYNIITSYTESDVESFSTSVCTRFRAREAGGTGIYTCINGDKYEFIGDGVSYDGGKTWDYNNIELGPMVESASSWCELPVQYKWEVTDDSTCLIEIERWTPSGYTCVGYDKYQNNVKEISHDGGTTWENTGIESASTLIEADSPDCGYIPPIYRTETGTTCSGCDLYDVTYYQVSYDNGVTWNTISSETGSMIEEYSIECGCRPEDENFTIYPIGDKGITFSITGFDHNYKIKYKLNSMGYFAELGEGTSITIPAGGKCEFRNGGTGNYWRGHLNVTPGNCKDGGTFGVRGNLSTLAGFKNSQYASFFSGLTTLVDAENLYLGDGSANYTYVYAGLFSGCTNLLLPPKTLPSRINSGSCSYMFAGCTSLLKTPEFATGRTYYRAYYYMFQGCTSLTYTMPLYAAGESMFDGCSSLKEITALGAGGGSVNWVRGVSETGTFYKSEGSSWSVGVNGIPSGWTQVNYTGSTIYEKQKRTIATAEYCNNSDYSKYYDILEQISVDGGVTWGTLTRKRVLVEDKCPQCGSIEPEPMNDQYLTFVALEDGTFSWSGNSAVNTLSYSLDSGSTWSTPASAITTSTISSGNTVMWKGNCVSVGNIGAGTFTSTGNYNAEGNTMSLIYGDNFTEKYDLTGYPYIFAYMFLVSSKLVNANKLSLPATTLSEGCYEEMFQGCSSLITAPELPATALTTACYAYMFRFCSSLTIAPVLSATTLVTSCYSHMFADCTGLPNITCLATDISASQCTYYWTGGILGGDGVWYDKLGTCGLRFYKNPNMNSWTVGTDGIPSCWDVFNINYKTSATTSTEYCVNNDKCEDVYSIISTDNGVTWSTASTTPRIVEQDSYDCGYRTDTVTGETYCDGVSKYAYVYTRESRDWGETWVTASTSIKLIEQNSYDCGYRTDTVTGTPYCRIFDKYADVYTRESTDSGTTWTTASTAATLIETQSSDCGCEPLDVKYRMTFNDGTVMSAECDSTSAITNNFFYNYRDKLIFAEIGDCVTSIAGSAFTYCSKIEQIVIGSGVTEMGGYVFKGCSKLNSVVIKATTPPTANGNVLRNSTCIVYVPSESLNAYKAAPAWANYKTRIQAIP